MGEIGSPVVTQASKSRRVRSPLQELDDFEKHDDELEMIPVVPKLPGKTLPKEVTMDAL